MVPSKINAGHNNSQLTRVSGAMDQRLQQLRQWVALQLGGKSLNITPVSGDASFRRYFRVEQLPESEQKELKTSAANKCWIAMDAPPEKEDSLPFVAIAQHWEANGIQVPHIEAFDLTQGFMLLRDFGDTLLLNALFAPLSTAGSNAAIDIETYLAGDPIAAKTLYQSALTTLAQIQACPPPADYALPPYDKALLAREMELFREWLVSKKLGLTLTQNEQALLDQTFGVLIDEALSQPTTCVHRDYHSRNLMELSDQSIGVLDFQDAVTGPITYDAVSLLRDCYIVLPDHFVEERLQAFYQATRKAGLHTADFTQFTRWFDLMGIQRHLKAAGIFARLSLRDGKHDYLNDVPRTVNYINKISAKYDQLADFNHWLTSTVIPAINSSLLPVSSVTAQSASSAQQSL
ncbi:aminoglycoside phosphotransferase family protein [Alkalimarinus coralli]|uniref:aminoglycoside phosphotransferase family protein n=1 Tax=Alkalimarinus coralli TaxID=2935863 RepID=UPI00202B922D|nr:phosphotransferase [Alkalimarinus coralli]